MNTVIEPILSEQLAEASGSMELLMRKIHRRQARVGIIGLGYVGLPLAIEFARAGFSVTGFDIDRRRTEQANNGSSYIGDVNDEMLWREIEAGRFRATTDYAELAGMDTISICVPSTSSEDQRSGSFLHHPGRGGGGGSPPPRAVDHPREHNLPGHNR